MKKFIITNNKIKTNCEHYISVFFNITYTLLETISKYGPLQLRKRVFIQVAKYFLARLATLLKTFLESLTC